MAERPEPKAASKSKSKKIEQGERTRAHLVGVARALFAEHGFAATSTEDVVHTAAVTRGALYHHFRDKADLFEAVFEQLESELVADVIREAARGRTPIDELRRGVSGFLRRCLDPAVQRVILRDGLAILGWERWYEIDVRYALGILVAGIDAAMDAGEIARQPAEPLAHLILGAMNHAGMYIAGAADPERARKEMDRTLGKMIDGLRVN
ncbi:MAG TPA: TetR family transcriptional regulator [Acidimicrobiales bacterium]